MKSLPEATLENGGVDPLRELCSEEAQVVQKCNTCWVMSTRSSGHSCSLSSQTSRPEGSPEHPGHLPITSHCSDDPWTGLNSAPLNFTPIKDLIWK